jgi:hypothetical protein
MTIRALEGTTIASSDVEQLVCSVCGMKLNLKADSLHKAVECCGIRYGVSYPGASAPTDPLMVVDAVKLPEQFNQSEEKKLEKEEEEQEANAKKEKATTQTTQQKSGQQDKETQTSSRKK